MNVRFLASNRGSFILCLFMAFLYMTVSSGEVQNMGSDNGWNASWIWAQRDDYTLYNDTIEAQKRFEVHEVSTAVLKITADTQYRLFINDNWVNDGPSRSWPSHYQYDLIDVSKYLQDGENTIRVIAKFFGIGTFHQVPQEAGLLAQLTIRTDKGETSVIGTDDTWEVRDVPSWLRFAPKQSVQMGPFEIYDARRDTGPWANAVVRYTVASAPWSNLEERDCPLLTRIPVSFKAATAARVVQKSKSMTFIFPTADWCYDDVVYSNHHTVTTGAFAVTMDLGDGGGNVTVDADGQTVFVDGKRAKDNQFQLEGGKHLLYVVLTEYWGHWRNDTEIHLSADKPFSLLNAKNDSTETPWCFISFSKEILYRFADYAWALMSKEEQERVERHISQTLRDEMSKLPSVETFEATLGDRARIVQADETTPSPHYLFKSREVEANISAPVEGLENVIAGERPVTILPSEAGDIELVYDLGEQNIGYYDFEIEAEEGLIVDIFGVEYIAPDGSVQHTERYRNGMRYICREGDNRFTSLMRRSQRYVFITLRNQTRPAQLKKFFLIESTYPVSGIGSFACSDEQLGRIWDISAHTLKLCMEDAFTDCPLYEQTLWVGDSRNEALFNYTAFGHGDIAKRCIRLAALSLDHYPLVQCQVPSTWETIIPVWGFLWNIMIWDYYEFSGDQEFLKWVFPYAMKNLRNAESFSDNRGLFSVPFWNMFDWSGIDDNHATVIHNNMFAVGAVDAAVKIARVLGKSEDEQWLTDYRDRLVTALNALWRDDVGMYPDSIHEDDSVSEKISIHNAFLPLLFDIAPEDRKEVLAGYLVKQPEGMTPIGSPFAILYLFAAMEKTGMYDEVIDRIREAYVPMLEMGATSVWETFAGAENYNGKFPTRSHTHAWSSAPVYFLNRIVLGIKPETPGGTQYEISPHLCGLTWAKGASAGKNGPVYVDWSIDGNQMKVDAKAPEGVTMNFVRNENLSGLKIIFNGKEMP